VSESISATFVRSFAMFARSAARFVIVEPCDASL
jgi:hypothetical protein